jgi:cytidylate kinase
MNRYEMNDAPIDQIARRMVQLQTNAVLLAALAGFMTGAGLTVAVLIFTTL